MKIFLVALIAAVASARRPPRGFDIDYSDSPPFFDSPPPSSRLSYLRPLSRQQSSHHHPRVLQSFSGDRSIISDLPPSYRGEKIIYDSLPPTSYYPRRPHGFYKTGPSSFTQELSIADEYRGPPPPSPNEDPRKQTSVTRDERPGGSTAASFLQLPTTIADEQESYQSAEQPISPEIPTRQPLSFGGHSNHLSYGNHGLGFASVAGVTSEHLDPLAIAEMSTSSGTTTTLSPSSPSEVQVSQQQPVTNIPNPTATSAEAKFIPTATQPSTANTASSSTDSESTAAAAAASATSTTAAMSSSVTPKTHLDSAQNSPSQTTKAFPMKLQEASGTSYKFGSVTQEMPAAAHGQLPLESARPETSHVLEIKQNLLHDENKASFPYQQFDYQFHQQNNNNAEPLRFTIPTATISTSPLSASTATATAMILPAKDVSQGLNLPQTPLAFAAVPNTNTFTLGQNQIDLSQLGKFSSINIAPQLPSYYYAQNTEVQKTQPNIPLASFYMLPNNIQPRQQQAQSIQPVQINTGVQSGIPLQFNGFGGIELLTSSSNQEPTRSDFLGLNRGGFNFQGQTQSSEPTFARIGFGQNIW